jgi:hypothetical protein
MIMIKKNKIIPKNPKIGAVVATYAAAPYIHLFLESAKRNFPHVPILVIDDGSPDFSYIVKHTKNYNAEFICNPIRLGHSHGDLAAHFHAIIWGKNKGFDIVAKFSRRLLPLCNWSESLTKIAYESQYNSFTNGEKSLGFRTECIAYHVNSWFDSGLVKGLNKDYYEHIGSHLVEPHIHDLARELQKIACDYNLDYVEKHPKSKYLNAYGDWDLIEPQRTKKNDKVLWHHCNSTEDYLFISEKFGLPYKLNDFQNVV